MHVDRRSFVRQLAGLIPACSCLTARASQDDKAKVAGAPVRVHLWCEGTAPTSVYPDDVDGALSEHLSPLPEFRVTRGKLSGPDAGLSDVVLDSSDVLVWWGHLRHEDVPDDRAMAVVNRVRAGQLGFVGLYATCGSKPFRKMMSTPCEPGNWREDGRPEHVSIQTPDHPIARGISPFTIPRTDMFSEPFAVPKPESVIFVSSWERGETLRSGLTWTISKGRVVYLRTGPETYPILFHPSIRRAIANSVIWTARRS